MLAFQFFMPIGGLLGSLKGQAAKGNFLGAASWFQIHRAFMSIAAALGVALMILSFVQFDALESYAKPLNKAHGAIGIGALALIVLQMVWATVARPAKDAEFRATWHLGHVVMGNLLVIVLGPLCIFTGIYALKSVEQTEDLAPWLVRQQRGLAT